MPDYANIPDHIPKLPELADQPVYPNPARGVFLTQPFQNWLIHQLNQESMQKIAKTLLRFAFLGSKESSILRLKKRQEKMCSLGNYINHGLQNGVPC